MRSLFIYHIDLKKTAWGPEMFEFRTSAAGTEYKKQFYVCGGVDMKGKVLKSCEIFNPNLKQWQIMPDMLDAKTTFSLVALNDNLYAFGMFLTI